MEKTDRLLPRAGPVRCRPGLGSEPKGLTQSCCPIPLPGDRNEVPSGETMCQNMGGDKVTERQKKDLDKRANRHHNSCCSPSSETVPVKGVVGPPGDHRGLLQVRSNAPVSPTKGLTHEENYMTRFALLLFTVKQVG